MKERRERAVDRRGSEFSKDSLHKCNRRFRPDRRLNSIQVEWIPLDKINIHPATRMVFSRG